MLKLFFVHKCILEGKKHSHYHVILDKTSQGGSATGHHILIIVQGYAIGFSSRKLILLLRKAYEKVSIGNSNTVLGAFLLPEENGCSSHHRRSQRCRCCSWRSACGLSFRWTTLAPNTLSAYTNRNEEEEEGGVITL